MKTSLRILLLGCLLQSLTSSAQTYCQPTYSGIGGGSGTYIDGFVLGTINNLGTGPTALPGYADYTNTGLNSITTVVPGSTNSATIFLGPASELTQYAIWVDLDRDHVYGPTEQLAYQLVEDDTASVTLSITIPADAQRGYTGMRVLCTSLADDIDGPCGVMVIGETEDYTVVIDDGAPCIPLYTVGTNSGDYIDGVTFGNIENTSSGGTTVSPYSGLLAGPNFITSVAPGSSYPMEIVSGSSDGNFSEYYTVWVDLDQDGVFSLAEKLATGTTNSAGEVLQLQVPIPPDAHTGYTRMRVICTYNEDPTDACGTFVYGETEDYTVIIDDGAPCIPVYAYGTNGGDYIDGFVFGTINNSGSGAQDGIAYSDFRYGGPGLIASVVPGSTYTATITSGTTAQYDVYAIWVDLDHDFTYEPNEELAGTYATGFGVQTTTLDVTIPADAPSGYTTMRVLCISGEGAYDACGSYLWGETEDYTIVIQDGSPCIPLYGAQANQGHYVSEVQLAGMSYGPVPAPSGYTDATNIGAHLQSGATSTLTMFGGSSASGYLSAWVDWGNGFELIGSLPVGTGFAQVTFDITPDYYYVGYARMRVAHTDANVGACDPSDFGSAVDFTLSVDSEGWPCLPLQGYGTQLGDGFTDMTIEGDAYAAQTDFPYYIAWSAMPYHHDAGSSITISFIAGSYAPETYRLSMDMNDDGDFFDTNEEPLIYTSAVAGEPITMVYPLPPNCLPGQHFMRLRANDDANFPLIDPCDDQPYGQLFDWLVVVEDPNGPCIPFLNQWTTDGDFIDGVQLGTIQNTGTGSAFGVAYQDYTAQSTTPIVGQPATLTITGGEYAGDTYSAWIDYNNDNDFDDAGESLGWIGIVDPFGTNDLPFTVPPGTTLGSTRMRVRCATSPMSNACLDASYGETEDYTVYIETSTGVLTAIIADLRLLPTTDGVKLLTDASLIGNSYLLLDATGRTLATGRITADRTDLPMLDFAHGAYTVQVTNGDARQVKRFVW
ncbi:MAG: hypothetical protein IPI41_19910 [Flavobacteriales bacterium]|nr:hypothetical protein [Flavobacteriales bacterium]